MKGGTERARSRPDEGGATSIAGDTPVGHETRSETKGRPLVGLGVPPAPTAEPAGGPEQAAHGRTRTAPCMKQLHPTGFHRRIEGASGDGGKSENHAKNCTVQASPAGLE